MSLQRGSKRLFSSSSEIGTYSLSRGSVGRKMFGKGWKHLQSRYPINLQERWHRASIERIFNTNILSNINRNEFGELDTLEYRMFFESSNISNNEYNNEYNKISPWHDIPFGFQNNIDSNIYFNYINEIPLLTRGKMECTLNEEWNPIKQDVKKGNLRYFKYGDLPFNYGFISQTWEDPNIESKYCDIKGLLGDGDPIDVVEISNKVLNRGEIISIKILGILGLIDEGETDWKIIGINANDINAKNINRIEDANNIYNKNFNEIILDWFRNYKVPDGKEQNSFSHNESYGDSEMAIEVIEECHRHWLDLMLGKYSCELIDTGKICLTSLTNKLLLSQGITSISEIGELPRIEYPRYDDWQANSAKRISDVDNSRDEFDIDEETSDQRRPQ